MKKLILTILLLTLTGCQQQVVYPALEDIKEVELGADLIETQKIDTEKASINNLQETEKTKDGKYKYIPRYEKDEIGYEVHEYETPNGSVGYQVFITGNGVKKSIGYGEEADTRTWEIPWESTASSTKL